MPTRAEVKRAQAEAMFRQIVTEVVDARIAKFMAEHQHKYHTVDRKEVDRTLRLLREHFEMKQRGET